jgi:hypothetical protein
MLLEVTATTYAESKADAEDNFANCGVMVCGNGAYIHTKEYDESKIIKK